MADFPISPHLAKVLLSSIKYKCSAEMIIIVSMLSVEDVYISPRGQKKQEEAHKAHSYFHHISGDHMTMLNIYKQWASPSLGQCSKEWCKKYFLHYRALVTARNIKGQLELIFHRLHLPILSCCTKTNSSSDNNNSRSNSHGHGHGHRHRHHHRHHSSSSNNEENEVDDYDMKDYDYTLILKSVCQAYYMNVAKRFTNRPYFYNFKQSTSDTLTKIFNKDQQQELVPLFIHPSSSIHSSSYSQDAHYLEWIIYHHTIFTNRCYLRHVSIIRYEWVKDLLDNIDKVDYSKLLEKDVSSIVSEERQSEEIDNDDDRDSLSVHDKDNLVEGEKEEKYNNIKRKTRFNDSEEYSNQESSMKKLKLDEDREEGESQSSVEESRKAALERYLQRKKQKAKKK